MAESMRGLKRSHRCGELNKSNVGEKVTVMGWVQKNRNKGGRKNGRINAWFKEKPQMRGIK